MAELPGLSTMSLKMDIIRFKDEILKDMRQMQTKLDIKYAKAEEELNEKLKKSDLKIKYLEEKIAKLSNLINNDNSMKEKIESIFQFKDEIQDTIFKRRAKFAEFEKKINDDIDAINKILSNTVLYPTMFGKTAKFQTYHEYIDYTVQEISQLNIFKNKSGMDLTPFKKKIDGAIEAFKIQINNLTPKEITNQMVNDLEEKMQSNFKLYDDRLQDTRVENSHYSMGIQKRSEEIEKQIQNVMNSQKYINKKIEKLQNMENYNILNNEILVINQKINKIFDILKELSSYHPEIKRNYPELDKKPGKKIISGVKQYIKGNLNADELTSMKKFAFEKSKTKILDNNTPQKPKTTQNITTEPVFYKFPVQKRQSTIYDTKPINLAGERLDFINKKFISKKSMNLTNQINNKISNEPEKFKRGTFERKNTFSFGKNAYFESSKTNNTQKKPSIFRNNYLNEEKNNNIIEEENEVNNNSNNSVHDVNENKYQSSLENENNKSDRVNYNLNNDKRDNIVLKENNVELKNNNKEKIENDKNIDILNSNEKEKDNLIDINNNISTNNPEKKKITLLININKKKEDKNKNNNDNIKQKKEKNNLLEEKDEKNTHTRNVNTLSLKNDTDKSDFSIEPNTNKSSNEQKNIIKIEKLNIKNNNNQNLNESLSDENENKNPLSDSNKLLIPINYKFKSMNPDISIVSIKKKLYKTYSNFPKINKDISGIRNQLHNNLYFSTTRENYTRNDNKYYKNVPNVASVIKQKNKILLMNPDNLPLNYFDKAYKDIIKNSSNENQNNNKKEENK